MSSPVNHWQLLHRAHPLALMMADRHYSRQSIGAPQFVPPGKNLVLYRRHEGQAALWVSLAQKYIDHAWPDSWNCILFRNETTLLSSSLIVECVAITRAHWGEPPPNGFITFIDIDKVRHKRDPGRCYRKVGWVPVGYTAIRHKLALQLTPDQFPEKARLPQLSLSL